MRRPEGYEGGAPYLRQREVRSGRHPFEGEFGRIREFQPHLRLVRRLKPVFAVSGNTATNILQFEMKIPLLTMGRSTFSENLRS